MEKMLNISLVKLNEQETTNNNNKNTKTFSV